jgi:hypothetical protein
MKFASFVSASLLALPLTLAAPSAFAQENPCGNFDFSGGLSCRIEVEGGCTAQCTPLKFEAGCTGQCVQTPPQDCVDNCGEQCITQCNPELLDCFKGCHDECDQPTIDKCLAAHPEEDCVTIAKAQCNMHCEESCEVPPSDCQEHCNSCCFGSCDAQINFDCNFDCFAELTGGCEAQCTAPTGAIFCNGQYVHASDVKACITYLATQGIEVDASAQVKAECGLSGCSGVGDVSGCSAAPMSNASGNLGRAVGSLALLGLVIGVASERRRRKHGS